MGPDGRLASPSCLRADVVPGDACPGGPLMAQLGAIKDVAVAPDASRRAPCVRALRSACFRGEMVHYVKPDGLLGTGCMAAITPFRHRIVYPQMMREMGRNWRVRAGAPPRACA